MITVDMIGKVRRMGMRDKLSISEIAKTTRLSRNTIKKWLKVPGDFEPKYRKSSWPGKLTAYMPSLEQCLKTDSHRPKHARHNRRALFKQIQAQGYRGGYCGVTEFICMRRTQISKDPAKALVPLTIVQFLAGQDSLARGLAKTNVCKRSAPAV